MACRNPWKKKYLVQKPTSAQPLLSYAEDRQLDVAVQRLIHVEETIRKLIKEMKKYIETIANLDRADQKLTLNLINSGLAHLSDEFRQIVEDYYSVTTQVGKTVLELEALYHKTFIEPLKKLREQFALIEAALIKREEVVTAWKASYNRLKKLEEKKDRTGNYIAKIEREHRSEEAIAKDLKIVHAQLLAELPAFLERRLEYMKPSVHALIMIQLDYYGTATQLFTQLMLNPNPSMSPSSGIMPDSEYHEELGKQIHRIKGLAIVKDHH